MALVHADNFSIYGLDESFMLDGIYAEVNDAITLRTDPDGISSGYVLRIRGNDFGGGGTYEKIRYVLPSNVTTCGMAMRVWMEALPNDVDNRPTPVYFKDAGNNGLFALVVTTTGRLSLRSGTFAGTVLAETTNPVITASGWYHIEAKCVIDATVGSIEVRVEGQPVIEYTNQNTGVTPVSQVEVANDPTSTSEGVSYMIKDFVIWDGNGSENTDFLGSVLVHNLSPTADASLNWTPSTGADGYSILDNIPPVDTDYIYAEDSPLPSAYKGVLSDLPDEVTSVKGIITFVRAAKSDGGDGSLQVGIISDPDGTPATALGADNPITVAQTYWRDVFETDPKTGAAWLPEAVNDTQIQINRTT